MKKIVSFSGGKDSTAMLHLMIDKGIDFDEVVFFDTGWEFPQMLEHIDLVEQKTGIKITRLHPEKPFLYWMLDREVIARKGENKGKVHRIGNGWPSPMRRWCTRIKVDKINKHYGANTVSFIGYAKDEEERQYRTTGMKYSKKYPLIDYGVTEAEALEMCKELGYHWGGLYDSFKRVSCFCCPLQGINELRTLRRDYPELWGKMLLWDSKIKNNRGFRDYDTVRDMEKRFSEEDYAESLQNKFDFA